MKNLLLTICILLGIYTLQAQTHTQTLYLDFGPDDVTNGNATQGPDENGNYWNNPVNPKVATAPLLDLVNAANTPTGFQLEITRNFSSNGINHGGLKTPEKALLHDFAISTATQDYFFVEGATGVTGEFKIKNLNPDNCYKFYVFGSRSDSNNRTALFTFTGLTTITDTHQTSGKDLGGSGLNQNNSTILETSLIFPDEDGNITIEVARQTGSYAHINILKIEEYTGVEKDRATSISISGDDITLSAGTTQINAEVLPANAVYPDIQWKVDNESIAWIDNNGKLFPKTNGRVNVTATIDYGDLILSDTKEIIISNQITELFLAGSAMEEGEGLANAVSMKMISDLKGTVSNMFEIYTSLNEMSTFKLYTSKDAGNTFAYGEGEISGSLAPGGKDIKASIPGTVRITVDLTTNTYTILPISKWSVVGSITPNGWSGDVPLDYAGNGVWAKQLDLRGEPTDNPPRFIFRANGDWEYSVKRIVGTDNQVSMSSHADRFGYSIEDIRLRNGVFNITLDLRNYTYTVTCVDIDDYKISMMGSSVANGQGATDMQGYAFMYNKLLEDRYKENKGLNWKISNISVNGNNTSNLLERWDGDLMGDCGRYVIYGLSLGNEGIHENGQSSFDSYKSNMQLLITKAREAGKIPVVSNNYTRGDFNATDYAYIKQMNLLIHEWDVPTINLLGAIDDGAGVWAPGYQVPEDIYHPTTEGHAEFFYAMVPSLFDALEAGKPLPQKISWASYRLGSTISSNRIELTPENVIHPFTFSFDIKTASSGIIASFDNVSGRGIFEIASDGNLVYKSPVSGEIRAASLINDDAWHKITLTHYYAWGKTFLYVDGMQAGELDEKLEAKRFYLSDQYAPAVIDFKDLLFYRSGMNAEEISALYGGKILRSSLEIYSPLDENGDEPLMNYAQSTNTIKLLPFSGSGITTVENDILRTGSLYSIDGRKIATIQINNGIPVATDGLAKGVYIVDNEKVVIR